MQSGLNGDQTALMAVIAAMGLFFLILLCLYLLVCWLLQRAFSSIPAEHRQMEPGMVWLLLIPCFNLFWAFMVYPKLGRSFRAYFESKGDTSNADCGEKLGLWYAIAALVAGLLGWIPFIGWILGAIQLVLLIVCLVKFSDLRKRAIAITQT